MTSSRPTPKTAAAKTEVRTERPKPAILDFDKTKFLYRLLAGVFAWQLLLLTWGVGSCFARGGLQACPDFGKRYETTFAVMISTCLALLAPTGKAR